MRSLHTALYCVVALILGLAFDPSAWVEYVRVGALAGVVSVTAAIIEVAWRYRRIPGRYSSWVVSGMGGAYALAILSLGTGVVERIHKPITYHFILLVASLALAAAWLRTLLAAERERRQ